MTTQTVPRFGTSRLEPNLVLEEDGYPLVLIERFYKQADNSHVWLCLVADKGGRYHAELPEHYLLKVAKRKANQTKPQPTKKRV